jgi:outer membrane lipoprotein-sorting protein
MRFLGLSSSIVGLTILAAGCSTLSPEMTKEKLLSKVNETVDPSSILREAKTKVMVCKVERHEDNSKTAKLFLKVKYPDKLKRMLVVPEKGVFIEAYNGKIGWTYSTKDGITQMKGKALDELKLQTAMAVNKGKLKEVFKTVELKGEEEIAEKMCYKVICTPKDIYKSQPITFYINKKSFLPQAKEEIFDGPKQSFPIVTIWSNYQKNNGVMIPMNRVVDMNNSLLNIAVLSVEWNTYIDDSEFEPPVKLK